MINLENLIEQITDLALEKWDPLEKAKRHEQRSVKNSALDQKHGIKDQTEKSNTQPKKLASEPAIEPRRAIPSSVRHTVMRRDGGQCLSCGTDRHLEFDHVISYAKGGLDTAENLRLLCRSCNQRHAIETYGLEKMGRYLD